MKKKIYQVVRKMDIPYKGRKHKIIVFNSYNDYNLALEKANELNHETCLNYYIRIL